MSNDSVKIERELMHSGRFKLYANDDLPMYIVQFSQTFIVCFFIIAITSNVKRYFLF